MTLEARARELKPHPGVSTLRFFAPIAGGIAFAFLLQLVIAPAAGKYWEKLLIDAGINIILAVSLNMVNGFTGQFSIGHAGFMAIGGYAAGCLVYYGSWRWFGSAAIYGGFLGAGDLLYLAACLVGGLVAALCGWVVGLPSLRLRGDYLAIVTLGFGEIARILFLSDALEPWFGGTQGILGVPGIFGVSTIDVPILGWELRGPTLTYYPLLFLCIFAAFVAHRLKYSRAGRAWNAMREDEDVAEATGVSTVNYKLLAFAMGAAIGCLGGAVFSTHLQSVFPGSFNILVSITVLAIVILGGMGSIPGVVVGALALIGLPELLREFAEFRLLVYGGVLVIMMLLRPEGLVPDVARRRELHEEGADPIGGAGALGTPAGGGAA